MIVLVPGFIEFIRTVDEILKELAVRGEMKPGLHPQAFRSALMGAVEGMLRDRMLGRTSRLPASFTDADIRAMVSTLLSLCVRN